MSTAGSASAPFREFGRARWLGSFAVIALIGWLGTHEVGRIVGDVPVDGAMHSPDALGGVLSLTRLDDALAAWARAAQVGLDLRRWLRWYLAFDLLLIAGYTGALLSANLRWRLRIRTWVLTLAVVDVIETILGLVAVAQLPAPCAPACAPAPAPFALSAGTAPALGALIALKSVLAAVVAVRIVFMLFASPSLRAAARQTGRALGIQRLPLLVVLVLGGLLVVPGSPILEQGVDVERSWLMTDNYPTGGQFLILGVLSIAALGLALRYLASLLVAAGAAAPESEPTAVVQARADLAALRSSSVEFWPVWRRMPYWGYPGRLIALWARASAASIARSWRWFAGAGAYPVLALILTASSAVEVHWPQVAVVAAVIAAVPLASGALALIPATAPSPAADAAVRRHALKVGHTLAWSVMVILLVSVVRAYIAPPMLLQWRVTGRIVLPLAGILAVLLTFAVLSRSPRLRLLEDTPDAAVHPLNPQRIGAQALDPALTMTTAPAGGPVRRILPLAAAALAVLAALLLLPITVAANAGVLAVIALCLLGVVLIYSMLMVLAQVIDPPHVVRLMRMRRTPVIALIVVISLLGTLVGGGTALHRIREAPEPSAVARPLLTDALADWLSEGAVSCTVPAGPAAGGPDVRVRPLIMVAAEGGGIRAAWWTVDAMTALTSSECGAQSVFLTSGVSGGATGLAMMATAEDPYAAMGPLAGQKALAAAAQGMLSRDIVTANLGLNVRALDASSDDAFPDRAGLMEQTWESQAPGLRRPFPSPDPLVPWHTVFNGTSVRGDCRVLVSDLDFGQGERRCDAADNPMPGSYDLIGTHPCASGIRTSTASLLAARFPYVTPSGILTGNCDGATLADQVIDGGYTENSGLDTIISALTLMMPQIRAHNAAALTVSGAVEVVVPVVVFLHNTVTAAAGLDAGAASETTEVLIPPLYGLSGSAALRATATLLARAASTSADWLPGAADDPRLAAIRSAAEAALVSPTMVVSPRQTAQMAQPLGWTLSQATRDSLDEAMDAYLACGSASAPDGSDEAQADCAASAAFAALVQGLGGSLSFPPSPR